MWIVKIQRIKRIVKTPKKPLCCRSKLVTGWIPNLGIRLVRLPVAFSDPGSFDSISRLRNAVPVLVFVLTFLSIGVAVVDNGTIFCYTNAFEAGYMPF